MKTSMTAAMVAALVLPVAVLAAMVGQQEYLLSVAQIVSVPLRGFDPRDLLRGHYIFAQLDWDWDSNPILDPNGNSGGLCLLATDVSKPRVRFVSGWTNGDKIEGDCRLMIAGRASSGNRIANFTPDSLSAGFNGGLKVFVSEERGTALNDTLRQRPGALTIDLAVRADGSAAIKALRLDGKVLGR
jgi:hypothetical protein